MSDYRDVPALLETPVIKPKALLAGKCYDSDGVRENLLWRGILPIILPKANCRKPAVATYGAIVIAVTLNACSTESSNPDAALPAMTKPPHHSSPVDCH
ncbi:hypothetical protein [Novosphingobium sp. HII-3]|uniref:hypothetical protein n=1 Tax=Novosphingobium sp. HII-3 TaxID=2075565 RepID=UPI000CDB4624